MAGEAGAFWLREPGAGEIRTVPLPAPGPGEVLVRTRFSGVSRGTETLVFRGEVPPDQYATMRAPFQEGEFPAPVKYGYLSVGEVAAGPADAARADRVLPLPAPDRVCGAGRGRGAGAGRGAGRAGRAGRHGGDRGQRALGRPAADRRPGHRGRRRHGRLLRGRAAGPVPRRGSPAGRRRSGQGGGGEGARRRRSPRRPTRWPGGTSSCTPARPAPDCSGRWSCWRRKAPCSNSAGTATARSSLALGGAFHSGRLTIRSSQVGTVARPDRTYRERLELALDLLRDPRFDALITGRSAFAELPAVLAGLASGEIPALCHLVTVRRVTPCSA